MKKKILITENLPYLKKIFQDKLRNYKIIFRCFDSQTSFKKFLSKNSFYAIYSTFGLKIDGTIFSNKTNYPKFIISPTTGLDHIDLYFCKKNNIKVLSLKNQKLFLKQITATAELTWAIILNLAKNLKNYSEETTLKLKWDRDKYLNNDLKGNTIGIIGYGRIGKIISKYAKAFGMKVFIYDIKKKNSSKLKDILKCKFITIHINLDNNYQIFTKKFFSKIKKDSFLINTSRGDIFDEKYLIKFIKSKKYNGLGLDVLPSDVIWKKKIPKNFQFIKNLDSNFVLTPHVGGNTLETRAKTTRFILSNFLKLEKLI
tara:strand:+ start:24427 stop:25368 length:942 start_codon:yes stop_codon:yes gene_type:complete